MAEDMNVGPVRMMHEKLKGYHSSEQARAWDEWADFLDEMFVEQSNKLDALRNQVTNAFAQRKSFEKRIAKIEADHAKWGAQIEKVLADTNALIKELAADITGGR